MPDWSRRALIGALILLTLAVPATAAAVPVTVNLRVEGVAKTIFDGPVTTDARSVTTQAGGGPHPCDGTASGDGLPPGPSATGTLDDGSRVGGFTFDGDYGNFGIQDFFITRIADETADPNSEFWSLYVDRVSAQLGGCQQRVSAGQEVLWARISFLGATPRPLELSGPSTSTLGQPVGVRVTDGATDAPVAGATVGGAVTGVDGIATLSFADKGIYRLKAENPGDVRSNTIVMCVDPPEALACSSTDTAGPAVTIGAAGGQRGGLASTVGRSRTMLISWAGDDGQGSGTAWYTAEVSKLSDGARASQTGEGDWRTLVGKTPANGVHFKGDAGDSYVFRITAADRALNQTTVTTAPVIIPVDDRSRRLWRFSKKGWERLKAGAAWGKTVMRSGDAGATARLRFTGTGVSLIGRKLPKGGRLRATIDGRSTTIRLRGRSKHRSVVWTSRELEAGAHTLALRTLGGGKVELDAVAPLP